MSWLHACQNHDNFLCECEDEVVCSCGQSKEHHIYAAPAPALTLRDWFAGHAMQDMLTGRAYDFEAISKNAYILADAMLKAREENGARP